MGELLAHCVPLLVPSSPVRRCIEQLAAAPSPVTLGPAAAGPREFVFVIDCSGSMHGEPISKARKALLLALRSMPAGSAFNVLRFGSETRVVLDATGTVVDAEMGDAPPPEGHSEPPVDGSQALLSLVPLTNANLAAATRAVTGMIWRIGPSACSSFPRPAHSQQLISTSPMGGATCV